MANDYGVTFTAKLCERILFYHDFKIDDAVKYADLKHPNRQAIPQFLRAFSELGDAVRLISFNWHPGARSPSCFVRPTIPFCLVNSRLLLITKPVFFT
jgi:hypothetical protein